MQNVFWSLFEKSGNIDAFMAYEDFKNYNNKRVSEEKEKNKQKFSKEAKN